MIFKYFGLNTRPVIFFLLILPGCVKKTKKNSNYLQDLYIEKAMFIDLPFPSDVSLYQISQNIRADRAVIGFTSALSDQDLLRFYNSEMELYGWENSEAITGPEESVLIFKKPYKINIISICKLGSGKNKVVVTISRISL